jgi:hypothetical protein
MHAPYIRRPLTNKDYPTRSLGMPIYLRTIEDKTYVFALQYCPNPSHYHHQIIVSNLDKLTWRPEYEGGPALVWAEYKIDVLGIISIVSFVNDDMIMLLDLSKHIVYEPSAMFIHDLQGSHTQDCAYKTVFRDLMPEIDIPNRHTRPQAAILNLRNWQYKCFINDNNKRKCASLELDLPCDPFANRYTTVVITNDTIDICFMEMIEDDEPAQLLQIWLNHDARTSKHSMAQRTVFYSCNKDRSIMMCASQRGAVCKYYLREGMTIKDQNDLMIT